MLHLQCYAALQTPRHPKHGRDSIRQRHTATYEAQDMAMSCHQHAFVMLAAWVLILLMVDS